MTSMLALLALAISTAQAAAPASDLDDDAGGGSKPAAKSRAKPELREIEKGTYAQANVGGAMYLGDFAGTVNPGTSLGLSIGHDFVDQEKTSMAFEFAFFQGIHNGLHYLDQADQGGPYVQGDLRTYSLVGILEWSTYPSRRLGLGLRAGGGMMTAPLLMDRQYYEDEVLAEWGVSDPPYHQGWHVIGMGGPTLEYYTKLNHFSVGLDLDVFYATDFDIGMNITGALKYTF